MSLREQGFRFVIRANGVINWTHPALVQPGDIDCTDMSDEYFVDTLKKDALMRERMANKIEGES